MKNNLWNIIASIQNGLLAKKPYIKVTRKKTIEMLLNVLWSEGFILGYKISKTNLKTVKIFLKYKNGKPVINSLKSVSKPSLRIYYSAKQLWKLNFNQGILLISTTKGFLSINECKNLKIGGEPFLIIK